VTAIAVGQVLRQVALPDCTGPLRRAFSSRDGGVV
jgi:hypothetical protein